MIIAEESPGRTAALRGLGACCSTWRRARIAADPVTEPVVPFVPFGSPQCARNGHVVVTYPNNSTYRGQFKDGKRHGRGTLIDAQGTKHEGEWRCDKRQGRGTEIYTDGTRFTGSYVDDLRSGHGRMSWPEGSQYSGQFERGKANGEGMLQRTDGSVYKGHFSEDSMSGFGTMQWRDGVKYVGHFVANRREGQGKMTWNSGKWHTFEGTWRNGMQHGQGTLVDHNGQIFHGVFQWGKLVRWCDLSVAGESGVPGPVEVPAYWSNQDLGEGFNQRNEVSEAFRDQVQRLLDGTFNTIRTRDRSGNIPTSLRLVKCHRVENSELWTRYCHAKERVHARRPQGVRPVSELGCGAELVNVRTRELLDESYAEHLEGRLNEHYLWHGTTPQGAIGISTDGFRLKLAGSHAGTYFGNGCYFAESSSKSDEYAREGDDLLAGIYALLLCRVTCGSLFRTVNPDEMAIQNALRSGEYDAVLGDREASVARTYREFVIYEEDLAYPEYVVLYERRFENPPRSPRSFG